MPNVSSTIKQHNTSLLHPEETNGEGGCNCQVGGNCPLNGACQVKCVVYKAEVTVPNDERLYYGISEGLFVKLSNGGISSLPFSRQMGNPANPLKGLLVVYP